MCTHVCVCKHAHKQTLTHSHTNTHIGMSEETEIPHPSVVSSMCDGAQYPCAIPAPKQLRSAHSTALQAYMVKSASNIDMDLLTLPQSSVLTPYLLLTHCCSHPFLFHFSITVFSSSIIIYLSLPHHSFTLLLPFAIYSIQYSILTFLLVFYFCLCIVK